MNNIGSVYLSFVDFANYRKEMCSIFREKNHKECPLYTEYCFCDRCANRCLSSIEDTKEVQDIVIKIKNEGN